MQVTHYELFVIHFPPTFLVINRAWGKIVFQLQLSDFPSAGMATPTHEFWKLYSKTKKKLSFQTG